MDRAEVVAVVAVRCDALLGSDPEQVGEGAALADDLGADSLHVVELVLDLEDHFGVDIDDVAMTGVATVGQLVDVVLARLGADPDGSG